MNRATQYCFSLLFLVVPLFAQANRVTCNRSTVGDFDLGLEPKARAFLGALKAALRTGDKLKIAGMVEFPLRVNTDSARRTVQNSSQFLADYDRLFTTAVRKAIEKQTPECLFANWQGVMIGDGEVWFEEQSNGSMKIKTLNIAQPAAR